MSAAFRLTDEQGAVMLGVVTFVRQGSRTLQLLGYAPEARYPSYRNAFEAWARSFSRLDDPRVLNAQALRLRIETLRAPATRRDACRTDAAARTRTSSWRNLSR